MARFDKGTLWARENGIVSMRDHLAFRIYTLATLCNAASSVLPFTQVFWFPLSTCSLFTMPCRAILNVCVQYAASHVRTPANDPDAAGLASSVEPSGFGCNGVEKKLGLSHDPALCTVEQSKSSSEFWLRTLCSCMWVGTKKSLRRSSLNGAPLNAATA